MTLGAATPDIGGFGGGTGVLGVGPFLMPAGTVGVCAGEGVAPFEGGIGDGIGTVDDGVVVVAAAALGSRGARVGVTFWLAATLASLSFSLRSSN